MPPQLKNLEPWEQTFLRHQDLGAHQHHFAEQEHSPGCLTLTFRLRIMSLPRNLLGDKVAGGFCAGMA
jgi:hypothetical protein